MENILKEALDLQPKIVSIRRELHQHPETGFDTIYTKSLVKQKLEDMGYSPKEVGKSGIVALVGGKKPGKTILLRADMDALPMKEEADIEYCSKVDGKMHGCGHDMHTAMLIGAAELLKKHEDEIHGTVKLEFQPAEEIFQGSVDMIKAGLLENPHVDAALMIHVLAGMPLPSGTVLVNGGGISSSSCEQYHIIVKGKGGHGSTPHESIDPITAAAHIHLALQEINSREIDGNQYGVFTTGCFRAGNTSNVIPDKAEMWGTIRTLDADNSVGEFIKKRITEISSSVGAAFRCKTEVEFYDYCPCMIIDASVANDTIKYLKEIMKDKAVNLSEVFGDKAGGGSEDFAFVSHKVPTASMFLIAGSSNDGYVYGQHNPKVVFDDSVLYVGSAAYVQTALRWLEEHSQV